MSESRGRGCGCGTVYVWLPFFASWFVYGSWKAGLVTELMLVLIDLVSMASAVIPLAGPFIYWFVAEEWIMPLFPRFGLEHTWLTELFFWQGLVVSVGTNLWVMLIIYTVAKGAIEDYYYKHYY